MSAPLAITSQNMARTRRYLILPVGVRGLVLEVDVDALDRG
ncbi:hypothetical protein [Streptomyces sp. NPDC058330]